jgi:hypothetical protein
MNYREIVTELERLKDRCEKDESESWDYKKHYKYLKNAIIEILDNVEPEVRQSDELLDEDYFWEKEVVEREETVTKPIPSQFITEDDLL